MKSTKTVIPPKLRRDMENDPFYGTCALYGYHNHECEGRITREHAIKHKGRKVQEKWAIPPICAKGHAVDEFQDAGTMVKELNEWVAYCRATDEDILRICGDMPGTPSELSKSKAHFQRKKYLIEKYGVWEPKINYDLLNRKKTIQDLKTHIEVDVAGENPQMVPKKEIKKPFWHPVDPEDQLKVKEIIEFLKGEGRYFSPHQVIKDAIRSRHEEIMRLKEIVDENRT